MTKVNTHALGRQIEGRLQWYGNIGCLWRNDIVLDQIHYREDCTSTAKMKVRSEPRFRDSLGSLVGGSCDSMEHQEGSTKVATKTRYNLNVRMVYQIKRVMILSVFCRSCPPSESSARFKL